MFEKSFRAFAALAMACASQIVFAKPEPAEVFVRAERYHITYTINDDGTHSELRDFAMKVIDRKGLEYAKRTYVSFSTSVEKIDIIEAFTKKADGRRIEVPKTNYQFDINEGRKGGGPAFSDRTQVTVIFPEVEVGDDVAFKYKLTQTEALFPGHFSVDNRFSRAHAYDDIRVRFDAPASLWTQHSVTGMTEVVNESKDGRKVIEWTWKNTDPVKEKRSGSAAYDPDRETGYSYSTFRSYAQIAEAYGVRARPKAVATERVRALAEEITKDAKDPREQARSLYEWTATNISYAGNCVGVGAVVPRDQAFVIDNKMGDCKDHATLLQALLSAKGIESTQALVNSGSTYKLPKVPVLSMVNHVIVYVPSLDLYLDSTSRSTPFGLLPFADSDKPVLLVDNYKEALRTPPLRSDANHQHAKSEFTLKEDGSIAGTIKVSNKGMFAVEDRESLRWQSAKAIEDLMNEVYRGRDKRGFGKLVSDDPKPLLDSFNFTVSFQTGDFARLPGPGAFSVTPMHTGTSIAKMIGFDEDEGDDEAREVTCTGGTLVEEYVYRLPKGIKVLALPRNVNERNDIMTYRATYSQKGNTVTVKRELVDRTPRNVCSAELMRQVAAINQKIVADLKGQVVYQ